MKDDSRFVEFGPQLAAATDQYKEAVARRIDENGDRHQFPLKGQAAEHFMRSQPV